MKLPDSEQLAPDAYWLITDQWKQEWERGVQVPVKPNQLPIASITLINQAIGPAVGTSPRPDFKL